MEIVDVRRQRRQQGGARNRPNGDSQGLRNVGLLEPNDPRSRKESLHGSPQWANTSETPTRQNLVLILDGQLVTYRGGRFGDGSRWKLKYKAGAPVDTCQTIWHHLRL
jgi:hypothetical protein